MKQKPTLADWTNGIINAWEYHVKLYTSTKQRVEELKTSEQQLYARTYTLEDQVKRIRRQLTKVGAAERAGIEHDLLESDQMIVDQRRKLVERTREIQAIEQQLEATWDIWTNDWILK